MNKVCTYNAEDLYTRLYGRKAYADYRAREAEIDKLMKDPHVGRLGLCHLREENFRRMKAEGEKFQAERAPTKAQSTATRNVVCPLAA